MQDTLPVSAEHTRRYELRFVNLFNPGRGFSFPCDALGRVEFGLLSDQGRRSYLNAHGRVGQELAPPTVIPVPADLRP